MIVGDVHTAKMGVVDTSFSIAGTLLKRLTTLTACNAEDVANGTDPTINILNIADGARIICKG